MITKITCSELKYKCEDREALGGLNAVGYATVSVLIVVCIFIIMAAI